MNHADTLLTVLDAGERRRAERRRFLRAAGAATATAGGLALLSACGDSGGEGTLNPSPTPTPTPTGTYSDVDILNFALNLEYLEAQFYSYAAFGTGLPASLLTGTQTQGTVTGGRQVQFTDAVVAQYAREIAYDEIAHVTFLRQQLGSAAVAMPAINIDGSATGAFTTAARAARVIDSTATFDPYASDENFLLGAFIFEDVGVTAYKGAAPLITNTTYLGAAAGILAAEAYHAGLIRTVLYRKGLTTQSLRSGADNISNARDSLDGPVDLDEGITGTSLVANIVPADTSGVAFSRTTEQVHNIVYLTNAQGTQGGFFPNGTNNANAALRRSGNFA